MVQESHLTWNGFRLVRYLLRTIDGGSATHKG
jgi:hypothetical protein